MGAGAAAADVDRAGRPRSTRWRRTATGWPPAGRALRGGAPGLAGADGSDGFADPRLGPELFSRKLSLTLQAAADADAILARAEADLERVTEEITRVAAGLGGTPREVLGRLGAAAPDESTILRVLRRRARRADGLRPRPRPGHASTTTRSS